MGAGLGPHLFATPLAQLSAGVAVALCVAAAMWGRWPERAGALTNALNCLATALLQDRRPGHHGQFGLLVADLLMLAVFVLIAMRCRRTWILWAAACALLSNLTDLSLMLDVRIQLWSFLSASYVWGLGGVVAIAAGIAFEGREPVFRLQRAV
jgi:hypothetical protein